MSWCVENSGLTVELYKAIVNTALIIGHFALMTTESLYIVL